VKFKIAALFIAFISGLSSEAYADTYQCTNAYNQLNRINQEIQGLSSEAEQYRFRLQHLNSPDNARKLDYERLERVSRQLDGLIQEQRSAVSNVNYHCQD
jgi:hypothetical protein